MRTYERSLTLCPLAQQRTTLCLAELVAKHDCAATRFRVKQVHHSLWPTSVDCTVRNVQQSVDSKCASEDNRLLDNLQQVPLVIVAASVALLLSLLDYVS